MVKGKDVRGVICNLMTTMLNNPDKHGIYPTSKFMDNLENYIKGREEYLLKKIEANLLFPFEGELKSGKELERPKILDMQRTAFNKIIREEGGENDEKN